MKTIQDTKHFYSSLKAVLSLANSHMVHFLTHDMFENILPKQIQTEINKLSICELNNIVLNDFAAVKCNEKAPKLIEFLNQTRNLYLKENTNCLSVDQLCERLGSRGFGECSAHIVKNLMSVKKSHEVEMMSGLIAALFHSEKCSHVVDVGGGKGYLSTVLTLKHKLKVLSIDSSHVTSNGAAKRLPKVEKLWKILKNKTNSDSMDNSEEQLHSSHAHSSNFLKLATLYISEETDITKLVQDNFPEDEVKGIMLVGLHTCGNLATTSHRLFIKNPTQVKCLVNVGCCYHLLIEEFDTNPSWLEFESQSSGVGFPASEFLRDQRFCLGRNARMLAAQPPERISQEGTVDTEKLFYRALLEVYLKKKLPDVNSSPSEWFRVGKKVGKNCTNFVEYVQKCVQRLKLNFEVDSEEVHQLFDSHSHLRKQLHAFFLLRLAVAPAIEAAVLLDRLLYLHEQGTEDAYLVQLFDPIVSPRCFATIAFNR